MLGDLVLAQKIVLSLVIGALVGLERERATPKKVFAGVRTFTLVCLIGLLSTFVSEEIIMNKAVIVIVFFTISVLTILSYMNKLSDHKAFGLTTQMAFILTFIIGLIIYYDQYPYLISISLCILITFILIIRHRLHSIVKKITRKEIWNAVIFAILTFIILPMLPNRTIDPFNSINLHLVWLMIVLILSVGFASYIIMKMFGASRGMVITGILGGFASSTAVVLSMSEKAKENKKILYSAAFAVVIACSTMFIRMIIFSSVISLNVGLALLIPLTVLGAVGFFSSVPVWKKSSTKTTVDIGSPLTLKIALLFGIFFILIMFFSKILRSYFGDAGIYPIALIGGLIDVDALTISLSSMTLSGLSTQTAVAGIIIAALSNTFFKWFLIRWMGTKKMSLEVGKTFSILIVVGISMLAFLLII